MSPEAWVMAAFATVITGLGILSTLRGGREDRIDRKRSSEIERLDKDVIELRADMEVVKKDSRLVAGVAIRAIRVIEKDHPGTFTITTEELEAIERTRPLVSPTR
jgi:hypothetical protein